MKVAIGSAQRQLEALRGNWKRSVAIGSAQTAIIGLSESHQCPSESHQSPSEVIRVHQRSSESNRVHQSHPIRG